MITLIRKVEPAELDGAFLWDFDTYQCCRRMWVKKDSQWSLERTSSVRQWSDGKKLQITRYLAWLIGAGGRVFGAFAGDRLVGFAALDKDYGGSREQYMNITMLFVDSRYQRRGVGKFLFDECAKEAGGLGAEKLFISSIPAENTVAFYFAMGCRDAEETIEDWIDMSYDRYLEYTIGKALVKPKPKRKPAAEPVPEAESKPEPLIKPEEKTEVKPDEKSTAGGVLRQRRRRNRGAQGKRRPGGAEQRPVPRRADPHAGRIDRGQAGDGHEDHDHGAPS